MEIKINDEFRSLHFKIGEENYQKLEDDLRRNGCEVAIKLYQGDIVDGFEMYEICMKNNIPYQTEEVQFSSKEEAMKFIINNQLRSKEITPLQNDYLIGRMYQIEKTAPGKQSHKKKWNPDDRFKTANILAKKFKISQGSVRRAETYAASIDLITKDDEELKNELLTGKIKITKEEVKRIAGTPSDARIEIIRSIRLGDLDNARKFIRLNTTGVPGRIVKLPIGDIKNERLSAVDDKYFVCLKCEPVVLSAEYIKRVYNHPIKKENVDIVYYDNDKWYCSDRLPIEFKHVIARLMNSVKKPNNLTMYLFTSNIRQSVGLESTASSEKLADITANSYDMELMSLFLKAIAK